MAKKRKTRKSSKDRDAALGRIGAEIDRFLEGGADADAISAPPDEKEPVRLESPKPAPSKDKPREEPPPEAPDEEPAAEETPEESRPHREIILTVSEDGLQAVVDEIYPETTEEEVLELLQKEGITEGVAESGIRRAIKTAQDSGRPVKELVAAEGTPPKEPAPTRLDHYPPEGIDKLPSLDAFQKMLESEDAAQLRKAAAALSGVAVGPGVQLARQIVDTGESGTDVRGQPILPPVPEEDAKDVRLQPGNGVEMGPEGDTYVSASYGYAGLAGGRVSVLSPFWVSPDAMLACYVNVPRLDGSVAPTVDHIRASIAAAGISSGIDEEVVEPLVRRLADGSLEQPLVAVARGGEPIASVDGSVEFSFPHETQIGAILPDGSIDFRETNRFPAAKEDDLLAQTVPAIPGTSGQTVRGDELPVEGPAIVELAAGEGVRLEEADGIQKLHAEIEGGTSVQTATVSTPEGSHKSYTVSLRPVTQIAGDVDYETGNVDVKGNVEVKGSVTGGFHVMATGEVSVGGSVEAGAEVVAGGSVTVRLGVVGEETHVKAGDALSAKFIHDARVEAGGDIVVGSYIHSAHVRTHAHLHMEGRGGSGGGIVGGETWAVDGITSKNVGSERSTTTFLGVGVDPELFAQYEESRQSAQHAGTLVRNLLKALGLKALDPKEIRKRVARSPSKKASILQYVKKANSLTEIQKKKLEDHQQLGEKLREAASKAALEVSDVAYARVTVRIGDQEIATEDDLKAVRYALDKDGRIVPGELSPSGDKKEGADTDAEESPPPDS
ncbi:MAG: FapA family protein [Candidatus Latescibacteria bacterium]|jgi:hypothetical protein|nr:FapA family protein [Candidatus Latescibacterota bacterium]